MCVCSLSGGSQRTDGVVCVCVFWRVCSECACVTAAAGVMLACACVRLSACVRLRNDHGGERVCVSVCVACESVSVYVESVATGRGVQKRVSACGR